MTNYVRVTYIHGFDVSHAFKLCKGLPVMHDGLYAMCEGLAVMQRFCLSHTMTPIVIHVCSNDVTMRM